jgi:CheY-like chemotaxis protein
METALLVEQKNERKKFLCDFLESEGLKVESFRTAEEAVDKALKVRADVLIVDVRIPKLSGFEALKRLKGHDFKVLFISANETMAVKSDLYSLGEVVPSEVPDEALKERIRGLLQRRASNRQRQPGRILSAHSVASHVLPELHDPESGRLDAGRITTLLGVPLAAFAPLSRITVAGLHKSPASAALQARLIPISRAITILSDLFGSKENVRTWMNSPHPDLGNETPIHLILEGKAQIVADLLEAALAGQPS